MKRSNNLGISHGLTLNLEPNPLLNSKLLSRVARQHLDGCSEGQNKPVAVDDQVPRPPTLMVLRSIL